ncbi:MAG: GWxTD domain-containing protein [candidate division WOR-3 bacterium]
MRIFTILILTFFSINIFANYDVSITSFKAQDNIHQIFYDIQFYAKDITYKNVDGKNTGILHFKIFVKNLETSQEIYDEWNSKSYISQSEQLNREMFLLDRSSFILSPAKYEIRSLIVDSFSKKEFSKIDTIILEPFDSKPTISNILVGYTVKKDSMEGKFTRNGYSVTPNPSKIFTLVNPLIYLYFEIYNLHNKEYTLDYLIYDTKDSLITTIKGEKKISPPFDFVVNNFFNTLGFKDGKYRLDVKIKYDDKEISQSTNFEKISNLYPGKESKYILTEEEMKYYSLIDYIATPSELTQFKSIKDEKAKHNFLINFWERRDIDKTNDKLESLKDFIVKVKYVRKNFSSGGEDGYLSARGRIYLKYGPPDETLLVPMSKGSKNYDSWIYYSKGGMQFIFMDIKGFGKYELIYTNVMEEEIPQNWSNYIDDYNIIQFYRN